MIITIDIREQELLERVVYLVANIPVFKMLIIKSETLPIGDIIISNETEEKLIIERKSVSDLLSSIKDGRYEEQSYRLNGLNNHNHNIIYLIEGDINRPNRFKTDIQTEKLTFYSAMFSLNYYKGFSVQRSNSLDETATMICNMAYKLEKENGTKKAYYSMQQPILHEQEENKEISLEDEKDYVSVIKKVKKENITPDNIGEIMLCQIPGISSVTALSIMEKYKNLPNLIKEIENDVTCLKDITSTNSKGVIRKINKTSIANIVKFLLKK